MYLIELVGSLCVIRSPGPGKSAPVCVQGGALCQCSIQVGASQRFMTYYPGFSNGMRFKHECSAIACVQKPQPGMSQKLGKIMRIFFYLRKHLLI